MKKTVLFLVMALFCLQSFAQKQAITGLVTSAEDGTPLPFASVVLKGTTVGTSTDFDGKFSLEASSEDVLVFSLIGFTSQEVLVGDKTEINVILETETTGLDEVVVVGYGVQKKSLVTGSISKVSGEELSKNSVVRVAQAMQGKTAGVVAVANSGQPGSEVSVRIRGTGTNGDASPLYIVDGLPLSEAGIDFLNPADVASLEVLKDAAACAIYGARGANGVVLITTKGGKKSEQMLVSYSGYYGVQNPWKKLDVLDRDDYIMLSNEANANGGLPSLFSTDQVYANTDWQDKMFYYDAPKQSHTISFEGGSEKTTYSSSINYFQQDGIVAKGKSKYEKIAFRLNTVSEFGFFKLGSNLSYANITNRGISANDYFGPTSLAQALNAPPIVPVKNEDGTWGTPEQFGLGLQEITNPLAMLDYTNSKTRTNKFIGNFYGEFDLGKIAPALEGLKFKSSFGTEFSLVNNDGYTPKYFLDATHFTTVDGVNKKMDLYTRWNFENVLTYTKNFGDHNISAMVGTTAFKDEFENISGSKTDVIFDDFEHAYLDNATDPLSASVGGGYSEHTLQSYFGRVNYDLMDKYMFTAVVRRDGSSRFGTEDKYGIFPAVSAGWIVSQEGFMSGLEEYVDFLKVRASWGQNGNENIGDFRYTSIIGNGNRYYFGSNKTQYSGTTPNGLANPSLKWETSEQTNIGLDLGVLDNKLRLTLDYYEKTTKDWLVDAPIPALVGNSAPTINGGEVKNSGFEFDASYKNDFGKLFVSVSLNGSFNKNEVKDIQNAEKRLQDGTGGRFHEGILYAEVGSPLGVFYGIKTNGIFQNQAEVNAHSKDGRLIQPNAVAGDIRFVDANNDGQISDADRMVIGDPYPDFTGGFNLNLEYRGFDLNMFWYASLGQDIWDATRRYDLNGTNYRSDYLNRWTGEGTSNSMPRVTAVDNNKNMATPSDFFVKDGSFARLRNLTLGYTFPKSVTDILKIRKLRLYVSGENLITITDYKGLDPEIGGSVFDNGIDRGVYPQARTILGGINVTF